jgi:short-subunit dehydrogenase
VPHARGEAESSGSNADVGRTARVVVVTGASSGIGRAIAEGCARRGDTVVINSRDGAALEPLAQELRAAGGRPVLAPGDVTREDDRRRLIDTALAEAGSIDVLVNNAGRGYYAPLRDVKLAELESLFALNVFAPLRLVQLALPALERSRGVVVMMSSVAGVVSSPKLGAYAASKFALEALSVALRAELAERGVGVVVVRPGPVETPFRANAVTSEGTHAGVRPSFAQVQSAEEIARLTLDAVDRRRPVVETSNFVRLSSFASRVIPPVFRAAIRRMAR